MRTLAAMVTLAVTCCSVAPAHGQQDAGRRSARRILAPTPSFENERYGPYKRNVFDIWLPASDAPTPLIVHIHGGGFVGGNKERIRFTGDVQLALDRGVAFASIQYRFRHDGAHDEQDPQRAGIQHILRDSARAIQYVRAHAARYNLDKRRIACYGGSAGAGTSIWLAFHDELADPTSTDPVLRESSRISAAGMRAGQFTYDIERWDQEFKGLGGDIRKTHDDGSGQARFWRFFGLSEDQYQGEEGKKWRADVDMENLISPDDPPICVLTNNPDVPPTSTLR